MMNKVKKIVTFHKLDLCKAFDSVDWRYLMEVMEAMRFGPKWTSWIINYALEQQIMVLVNGSIMERFDME